MLVNSLCLYVTLETRKISIQYISNISFIDMVIFVDYGWIYKRQCLLPTTIFIKYIY